MCQTPDIEKIVWKNRGYERMMIKTLSSGVMGSMRILISGGTGFIGHHLTQHLLKAHHHITILSRSTEKVYRCYTSDVAAIDWSQLTAEALAKQDLIIHLAGQNIGERRWTARMKSNILQSRVETTKTLATLCGTLGNAAPRLLSASAVGIYGLSTHYPQQPNPVDESWPIPPGDTPDFLSQVGQAWEQALKPAIQQGVATTIMRFGVVLHPKSGMLKKLLPAVKLGLGGHIGNGQQWLSWVHIDDLILAIDFFIQHPDLQGAINVTSPHPIQQRHFIETLCRHHHRPCFAHLPAPLVKWLFGEMGSELLLGGQQVLPTRLQQAGFTFLHPTLEQAL